MDPVVTLQLGGAFILNAAFAWLAGLLLTRRWLASVASHATLSFFLRRSGIAAALIGLAASAAALWAGAAVMGGVTLGEALPTLPMVLSDTSYGRAGLAGMAVMAAMAFVAGRREWQSWDMVGAVLLLLFAMSRALISHAGEHGVLSSGFAVEVVHLLLIGIWLGGVAIAGWVVVPTAGGMPSYLASLSQVSTVALAGIVASGVYNSLVRLSAASQLVEHPYGMALTVKLGLFLLAVMLGGMNRFWGFPAASQGRVSMAVLVLRVESVVLLGVLAAAAVLASTEPP